MCRRRTRSTTKQSRCVFTASEAEHEQHRRVLHVLQRGRFVQQVPGLRVAADQHGDILLAVDCVGHRRSRAEGAGIKAPEGLQRFVIQRVDRSIRGRRKREAARRRSDAGGYAMIRRLLRDLLARRGVHRGHASFDVLRVCVFSPQPKIAGVVVERIDGDE